MLMYDIVCKDSGILIGASLGQGPATEENERLAFCLEKRCRVGDVSPVGSGPENLFRHVTGPETRMSSLLDSELRNMFNLNQKLTRLLKLPALSCFFACLCSGQADSEAARETVTRIGYYYPSGKAAQKEFGLDKRMPDLLVLKRISHHHLLS